MAYHVICPDDEGQGEARAEHLLKLVQAMDTLSSFTIKQDLQGESKSWFLHFIDRGQGPWVHGLVQMFLALSKEMAIPEYEEQLRTIRTLVIKVQDGKADQDIPFLVGEVFAILSSENAYWTKPGDALWIDEERVRAALREIESNEVNDDHNT